MSDFRALNLVFLCIGDRLPGAPVKLTADVRGLPPP
jgi:hypothetical protein